MLALIPFAPAPKALSGFVEDEPKEPNEAGEKAAGEKALPSELLDNAVIGDKPDMAPIGFENDIPG